MSRELMGIGLSGHWHNDGSDPQAGMLLKVRDRAGVLNRVFRKLFW